MYRHELSLGHLWQHMNWVQRLDVIVLALMLAHIVIVVIQVFYRYRLARRAQPTDTASSTFERDRRKLIVDLSLKVGSLNSIAFVAPYLGLAGTSFGIVAGLRGVDMLADSALAALIAAGVLPIALVTTAAGLIVAIPASWSYNYLCSRIDLLEIYTDASAGTGRHRRIAQKLPLATRFSTIPFPLVATPSLAILAGIVFMEYASYKTPTGLYVAMTPATPRCEDRDNRPIILHITDRGKLFLNAEPQDWNNLQARLSAIYGPRMHRSLYLVADDQVPFQTVADALSAVRNTPTVDASSNSLDISVHVMLPRALGSPCPDSAALRSSLVERSDKTHPKRVDSERAGEASWDPIEEWDSSSPRDFVAFFLFGSVFSAPIFLLIRRVRTRKRESTEGNRFLE